jgi:hypothetical protein
MTKSNVTAEEKERLKRGEMERLRNNFLKIRPGNDKALENDLRRQTPVPLSPKDLVFKESAEVFASPDAPPDKAGVHLPHEDTQEQEAINIGADGRGEEPPKELEPRSPAASVASPIAEVLFKELGPQIKAFRTTEPARRITVSVSEEVFSRVSHLHFVERVGKLEIMSFLMERYVPKARPEKLPRFLAQELEDEDHPRYLTFFEDLKLAEQLDWLKARHGFTKVAVVENIVRHALPAAPFKVPPTKRRRGGLARRVSVPSGSAEQRQH